MSVFSPAIRKMPLAVAYFIAAEPNVPPKPEHPTHRGIILRVTCIEGIHLGR